MTAPGPSTSPTRRRFRPSVWTLLAPVALGLLVFFLVAALKSSPLISGDEKQTSTKTSDTTAARKPPPKLPVNAKVKIKQDQTLGAVAAEYGLTEEELKACNPKIDTQSLPVGTLLFVSQKRCKGSDLAPRGANPDPRAGETTG